MNEPRTPTGRHLFTDVEPMDMWESDGVTPADILAIEAEAVADLRAELAAAVRGLAGTGMRGSGWGANAEHIVWTGDDQVSRAAVLALLVSQP
jgi:hypothetical protein